MSDEQVSTGAEPFPIDGTLDLHTFRPEDIGSLIPDYLELCRERGIVEVRIVHGKGTGALRRGVHALLDRLDGVESYSLAPQGRGEWGATVVELRIERAPAEAGASERARRASHPGNASEQPAGDRRRPQTPKTDEEGKRSRGGRIRGTLAFIHVVLNTLVWGIPLILVALIKAAVPVPPLRRACSTLVTWMATTWVALNGLAVDHVIGARIESDGLEDLDVHASCLVTANHQSWTDIVILQRIFHRRIPFLRFFIKQELIWVPVLGLAWWGLDFPFMKRYSGEYLARHPEKRGADMEETRRACARLSDVELSITNFLEGTRFTAGKHERQGSPYKHLLQPRSGGVGFALHALPEKLDRLVDATIVYHGFEPGYRPTIWDFLCGRARRIEVKVAQYAIPHHLRGRDYSQDEDYRQALGRWLAGIWEQKDAFLELRMNSGTGADHDLTARG